MVNEKRRGNEKIRRNWKRRRQERLVGVFIELIFQQVSQGFFILFS